MGIMYETDIYLREMCNSWDALKNFTTELRDHIQISSAIRFCLINDSLMGLDNSMTATLIPRIKMTKQCISSCEKCSIIFF